MNASSGLFPHKCMYLLTDKFRKLCGFEEKGGYLFKKCVIFKTQVAISALVKSHPESCCLEAIFIYHDAVQIAWVPGLGKSQVLLWQWEPMHFRFHSPSLLIAHQDTCWGWTTHCSFLHLQSSKP